MIKIEEVVFAFCVVAEILFEKHSILLAQKIELRPDKEQEEYLIRAMGTRRYAYNQLVSHYRKHDKLNKTTSTELIKQMRKENHWMQEFSTRVARCTVEDIDTAISKQFETLTQDRRNKALASAVTSEAKIQAYNLGSPQFAKKGINESFAIREKEKIKIQGRSFSFEKMPSMIKMRNKIRFSGIIKQVTIKLEGGKFFASFLIQTTDKVNEQEPSSIQSEVGVDLGVKELATLSNGIVFPKSQELNLQLFKLKKLQQKLSNQVKDSNNYNKTKLKIQKLHYYIKKRRESTLHEFTSYLVKNFTRIAIEDLDVKGMLEQNSSSLSRAIADVGFGAFRAMLTYKCELYGVELTVVDRFFASSKICYNCKVKKNKLSLSERIYNCSSCNTSINRDLNASLNLKDWKPLSSTAQ